MAEEVIPVNHLEVFAFRQFGYLASVVALLLEMVRIVHNEHNRWFDHSFEHSV